MNAPDSRPDASATGDGTALNFVGLTALSFQVVCALYFFLMLTAVLPPAAVWGWAAPIVVMPVLSVLVAVRRWLGRWPLVFIAGLGVQLLGVALFVFVRP